jgi:hypothetical protein
VLLLVRAGAAQACEDTKVLFEDDFTTLETTWKIAPDEVKLADGKMVLSAKPDSWLLVPNSASVYDDIDICADVTTIEAVDPETNFVGLVFWYGDDRDFYVFEIGAKGEASAWRLQRGKWLKQVGWVNVSALHSGDGATNQLRVVTAGRVATLYLNGEKFRDIKGEPPENGQQIGVIGSSPKKGIARYAFDNVKITEPEETSAK